MQSTRFVSSGQRREGVGVFEGDGRAIFFFSVLIFFHIFFFLFTLILVDFVLEYIQVVGGGHSNDVLLGVPCSV